MTVTSIYCGVINQVCTTSGLYHLSLQFLTDMSVWFSVHNIFLYYMEKYIMGMCAWEGWCAYFLIRNSENYFLNYLYEETLSHDSLQGDGSVTSMRIKHNIQTTHDVRDLFCLIFLKSTGNSKCKQPVPLSKYFFCCCCCYISSQPLLGWLCRSVFAIHVVSVPRYPQILTDNEICR